MLSAIKQAIKNTLNQRFQRWLNRRVPSKFLHKLSNRNIFIMPTRFGFAYLFFDLLLFLLGTNYQNNIILLLSYLLASLFITVMMHSFYNFSQLSISSKAQQSSFSKQMIHFPINITGQKRHYDINFQFIEPAFRAEAIKLAECDFNTIEVLLPWYAKERGVYQLGRVKVFSEYSLGLFITWSLLDFSHQAIVYPEPKKLVGNQLFLTGLENNDQENIAHLKATEGDDYAELKNYILGESQARIAWKQLARGQGKFSKSYQAQQSNLQWLKLSNMPSNDIEENLQCLCFLILEYTQQKQTFGLLIDLPTNTNIHSASKIEPNSGLVHQEECLMALAKVKRFNV